METLRLVKQSCATRSGFNRTSVGWKRLLSTQTATRRTLVLIEPVWDGNNLCESEDEQSARRFNRTSVGWKRD